ncbi:cytochrome P450 [Microdochium bolleyi]|uniref:Cytochrome P450 n=1 Tax=Microdochium bolleyi TaxID=196109 RepID=A0A136IRD6_9PEZI|nr:cytochrome P450 [Microdochium bolleyi]
MVAAGSSCTCLILSACAVLYSTSKTASKLPESNPRHALELTNSRRLGEFMTNSIRLLKSWDAQFLGKPYRMFCEAGEVTMLPPKEVDAIRSDKRFDFQVSASDESHGYIPGFEALGDDQAILKVVNKHLTKVLTKLTAPLSEEAEIVIQQTFGDSTAWKPHNAPEDIMKVVSRMSSRVFMGAELCKDDKWNAASANYTRQLFSAMFVLNEKPRWLRPYIHWFMPVCQEVRKARDAAHEALEPHLKRREQEKAAALARGEPSHMDDSIEWFAQEGSTCSPAIDQVRLSVVAIHTTSDLLCEAMINIAANPKLFEPLREEVIRVLSTYGLKKTALYELQLMDAVFKEAQRLKPISIGWKRKALEDVTLPSGMLIKKGEKVGVSLMHMWDDNYWKDAATFDPYRFMRMRATPDQSHAAHLVSTSTNHLGFGHGVHACPGRFFASNEVKIAMCHLLLKYDWKLAEGSRPEPIAVGMGFVTNPKTQLLFRRRKEELDFSTLES